MTIAMALVVSILAILFYSIGVNDGIKSKE